ncbi:MAG: DJ-1/PfpI family protein [Myxococcaceae bacterium]
MTSPLTVGLLAFPDLTQLDLTGPYEIFARAPGMRAVVVGTRPGLIRSDSGLSLGTDCMLDDAPPLDVLCIPGGIGVNGLLTDDRVLDFVADRGARAAWVTSVCTGALVLGAAGLLRGYRATTHWLSLDLLADLGATPVEARVVRDRNRITGGGVTAGIDFALTLVAELHGREVAERIQLTIEYDPAPPFRSGSPRQAAGSLVAALRTDRARVQDERKRRLREALARRGG